MTHTFKARFGNVSGNQNSLSIRVSIDADQEAAQDANLMRDLFVNAQLKAEFAVTYDSDVDGQTTMSDETLKLTGTTKSLSVSKRYAFTFQVPDGAVDFNDLASLRARNGVIKCIQPTDEGEDE